MTNRIVLFLCTPLFFFAAGTNSSSLVLGQVPNNKNDQEVAELVEQLDSPKFSERAAAQRRLQNMGAAAVKPLESVVINGDSDSSDRALSILKRNFRSGSDSLSLQSKEALQRIAANEGHPKASAAERILQPPAKQSPNKPLRLAPGPQMIQGRVSVKVRTVNGVRDISVEENGRKWRFSDVDAGIKVQRPDGKGGIKVTEYKDEKSLEKADNEAYKVYKRYSGGGGNGIQFRFNGGGMQIPQMQIPGFQQPFPAFPNQPFQRRLRPLPQQPKPAPNPKPAKPANEPKLIEV